jgi:hypothetical protein
VPQAGAMRDREGVDSDNFHHRRALMPRPDGSWW